jgi:tRNA A37 threonylcarbamoyladenosine biosynthesis protein TsaE
MTIALSGNINFKRKHVSKSCWFKKIHHPLLALKANFATGRTTLLRLMAKGYSEKRKPSPSKVLMTPLVPVRKAAIEP